MAPGENDHLKLRAMDFFLDIWFFAWVVKRVCKLTGRFAWIPRLCRSGLWRTTQWCTLVLLSSKLFASLWSQPSPCIFLHASFIESRWELPAFHATISSYSITYPPGGFWHHWDTLQIISAESPDDVTTFYTSRAVNPDVRQPCNEVFT